MDTVTDKAALRAQMRQALRRIAPRDRAAWSQEIARRAFKMDEVRLAKRVMLFWAMDTEPDTSYLIEALWRMDRQVYLPRVLGGGDMEAARHLPGVAMEPGPYGIWQSAGEAGEVDLVLAPGMAFDRFGGRLGHGGGYYDRFLERSGARAIGLGFEIQMVERVPRAAHDRLLWRVVTERAAYEDGKEIQR